MTRTRLVTGGECDNMMTVPPYHGKESFFSRCQSMEGQTC